MLPMYRYWNAFISDEIKFDVSITNNTLTKFYVGQNVPSQ